MKKHIFIAAILLLLPNIKMFGRVFPLDSLRIQRIINVPNASKDTLHKMVAKWFESASFDAQPRTIIDLSVNEDVIKGDYTINFRNGGNWNRAKQTITIELRDEMIRISIEDPYWIPLRGHGTETERVGTKWNKLYKKYAQVLRFVRNNWRKNIKSLDDWVNGGYRSTEKFETW